MAIGNKQIGWSQESNLLWEISKQLDRAIAVLCTGPCPTTTTTTTTPLCNYLYEGVLTVGTNDRNIGYLETDFGSISPLDANFITLEINSNTLTLGIITLNCFINMNVYINGTLYILENTSENFYQLEPVSNPFPPIGETCIIQICPGNLCA